MAEVGNGEKAWAPLPVAPTLGPVRLRRFVGAPWVGRFLFRHRALAVYGMILSTLWVAPEAECSWFFVPLFLLGAAIRVWAAGCAGEHTRTRSDRVPRLVTHGPYAIVRNPLYVANLMLVASALAAAGFRIMAVVATLVFGVVYQFVVRYEEENLRARFGDRYDAYRRRTPRWIPRQWPSFRPLPLREGLWRERFNARTYVVFVLAQVARETLLR